jgi:DNA ligase-associated metallophosphoesterase
MLQASRGTDLQAIPFHGTSLLAEASGALIWPDERTLVVADLHLEKGSSFARRGAMLPPYDTRVTLDRLERAAAQHDARRIVCLGDSFHDGEAPARLDEGDARRLSRLTAAVDWIWIAGNHDPAPPAALGGRVVTGDLRLGPLTFRHIAEPLFAAGEISGHYHPKASLDVRGRRLSGRCFVVDEHRLVLPAFGAYAGGLDVFEPALRALFPGDFAVHLLARDRITSLPHARLAGFW